FPSSCLPDVSGGRSATPAGSELRNSASPRPLFAAFRSFAMGSPPLTPRPPRRVEAAPRSLIHPVILGEALSDARSEQRARATVAMIVVCQSGIDRGAILMGCPPFAPRRPELHDPRPHP